jgi:predicted aldo/keto reductase-like oxidoreductase
MNRRTFTGGAFAGLSLTGAYAQPPKAKAGDIPTVRFGKTNVMVTVIGQGGQRLDLQPDMQSAVDHVRRVYDLGVTYFDCARLYWDGKSEETYGVALQGIRKNVFLTTKSIKRTKQEAEEELATSLRLMKTDYLDLWQMHSIQTRADIDQILGPGGAMEAFEAAKKAGKCRFIGFTGHFDPEAHVAFLKAYDKWDSVLMPIHASDHAYLSFEKTALPVAADSGVGVQAMKVFGKAYLLRSISPNLCLRYALSQPGVHVAVCGCATLGQMEDNVRTVKNLKKMTTEEMADTRKRALAGLGAHSGPTLEYWKKKV